MTQIKHSQSTDPAKTPPTRETPAVFMGRNLEEEFAELGLPRNTFVTSDMTVLMAYAMALGATRSRFKQTTKEQYSDTDRDVYTVGTTTSITFEFYVQAGTIPYTPPPGSTLEDTVHTMLTGSFPGIIPPQDTPEMFVFDNLPPSPTSSVVDNLPPSPTSSVVSIHTESSDAASFNTSAFGNTTTAPSITDTVVSASLGAEALNAAALAVELELDLPVPPTLPPVVAATAALPVAISHPSPIPTIEALPVVAAITQATIRTPGSCQHCVFRHYSSGALHPASITSFTAAPTSTSALTYTAPVTPTTTTPGVAVIQGSCPTGVTAGAVKRWYVVTKGLKVGIMQGWPTVKPFVVGVSGAECVRYGTFDAAKDAFEAALAAGEVQVL